MSNEFRKYRRKGLSEMREYVPGESLVGIRVSCVDKSEIDIGMIARNPANHADQWYVARKYFEENFELVEKQEEKYKEKEEYINSRGGR